MPTGGTARAPRPRADAQRNRERLLVAADAAFGRVGAGASLDDIARAAGVGNATLYRHFPTRAQLISAVYAERIGALCALAVDMRAREPAGAALLRWLRAVIDHLAAGRGLREAFVDAHQLRDGQPSPEVEQWHRLTDAAVEPLLADAEAAGVIRTDLRVDELMALVSAVAHISDDPGRAHRLLELTLEGLMLSRPSNDAAPRN